MQILDTWHSLGMRGTDSNDVVMNDVFVPRARTFPLAPEFEPGPYHQGALYRFPGIGAASFHLSNGFFMNWVGNQAGEGYEFHILAIAMALALVIGGGGALAIDRAAAAQVSEPREVPATRLKRAA